MSSNGYGYGLEISVWGDLYSIALLASQATISVASTLYIVCFVRKNHMFCYEQVISDLSLQSWAVQICDEGGLAGFPRNIGTRQLLARSPIILVKR